MRNFSGKELDAKLLSLEVDPFSQFTSYNIFILVVSNGFRNLRCFHMYIVFNNNFHQIESVLFVIFEIRFNKDFVIVNRSENLIVENFEINIFHITRLSWFIGIEIFVNELANVIRTEARGAYFTGRVRAPHWQYTHFQCAVHTNIRFLMWGTRSYSLTKCQFIPLLFSLKSDSEKMVSVWVAVYLRHCKKTVIIPLRNVYKFNKAAAYNRRINRNFVYRVFYSRNINQIKKFSWNVRKTFSEHISGCYFANLLIFRLSFLLFCHFCF